MLLRFHGADRTVTGSCHLVETNGLRLLLDFGLYQGSRDEARMINSVLPPALLDRGPDGGVDAVILSHGHLDHCGRLPLLRRNGFKGPIYCTPATADVARVVMLDAAKIQEEDAGYLNQRSRNAGNPRDVRDPRSPRDPRFNPRDGFIKPLFTVADVQAVLPLFKPAPFNIPIDLGHGVNFTFREAGHILGSAYILLRTNEAGTTRSLLFTADMGRYGTPIIRDPFDLQQAMTAAEISTGFDVVITESTYGSVTHAPMFQVGPQLLELLKTSIAKGGRLLLPSFAVGRTQTMLWYVQRFMQQKLIPEIPIFVDSPMGSEISRITAVHADSFDEETRRAVCDPPTSDHCDLFGFSKVSFAITPDDSRKINDVKGPCVIIASSPTCEFGRILHHLKRSVDQPNDTIVFVGWTPPHTLGRRLQDGNRHVRILDRDYDLRCTVKTLHGLSAHADGNELLRFLKPTLKKETTAFVVHGEPDRCDIFAARLTAAGVGAAIAPATNSAALIGQGQTQTDEVKPTQADE